MTEIMIRNVQGEERYAISRAGLGYAFYSTPPLPDEEEWKGWMRFREDSSLMLTLFEGDLPVVTVAGETMLQNVRGRVMSMGGVWGVTTHPAARRKGYVRRLMGELMERFRQQDMPVSCLYAFRESFYQRLGYVQFPHFSAATFSPVSLQPLLKQDLGGAVTLLPLKGNAAAYVNYLRDHQLNHVHGFALNDNIPALNEFDRYWLALATVDDETVGVMIYQFTGEQGSRTMNVRRFYYHTSQGKYLLLEWFARHIDQAEAIKLHTPPYEHPETWYADLNVKTESLHPTLGRVVDISALAGIETGPGAFSAQVEDPLCPWNTGVYRFETVDGKLTISQAETPDCHLHIQALSALVYGTHDPADFAIRGWGDPAPAVQKAMQQVFPAMLPYAHETF